MQLRFATELTSEEYVSAEGWQEASLSCCPLHGERGCRFARHGTYERKKPPGTRIARWYCRDAQCTFSLLPDCLASRLPGTLDEVEEAVLGIEQAPSLEAAADVVRPDEVFLPAALRWMRRRLHLVRASLLALVGLLPDMLAGRQPEIAEFRAALKVDSALSALREIGAEYLPSLPPPLGFGPRPKSRPPPKKRRNTTRGGSPAGS